MSSAEKTFQAAFSAFNARQYDDAARLFRKFLKIHPSHVAALNLLTVVLMQMGRFAEAEEFSARAVKLNQGSDVSLYNYGLILKTLNKPQQALQQFTSALRLNAKVAETWNNRGTIYNDLREYDQAAADFDQAILLNPNYADAFANKGKSFGQAGRHDEAFAAYDRALSLKPDLAEAWFGRAASFSELKRYDEALVAYDKALSLKPDLVEGWLGRGNVFVILKRYDEALAAYDRVTSLQPDLAEAWLGRGNVCFDLGRYQDAFAAHNTALSLKPDLAEAWLGRGNVFSNLGRYDEGLADYDKALALKPDLAEVWPCRGNVLTELKRFEEAVAAYDTALSLKPDLLGIEGARLHARMQLCDWSNIEAECDHLVQSIRAGRANTSPFVFLGISPSPEDQLNCARLWIEKLCPSAGQPFGQAKPHRHDKIRIGYVSSDFRQHAVAMLIAGVFECHDRSQFEVTGISTGPNDNSEIRRRLENAFDGLIDATGLGTDQLAKRIREQEIDVLIDLNGFTGNGRTDIFARRSAPVQVNYLGYSGTMGAEFIDYMIADSVLVPASEQRNYMEKIAYLPHSYLPHDDASRPISDRSFARGEFGLPENGFVFCCFNNAYKLNPAVFRSRLKLLKAIAGSVFWLSENNAAVAGHLRNEAIAAGVDPDRLVFASRLPSSADHLARHRLADLFLDTLPYNAHTTASDALWAGLPVLTQIGESFAGRVAASLLTAVGLPELIARTPEQFESMAIELAGHPRQLAAIKDKLAQNRSTTPLFNTRLYTRHLESAYATMHQRHQQGLAPDHIQVPEQIP